MALAGLEVFVQIFVFQRDGDFLRSGGHVSAQIEAEDGAFRALVERIGREIEIACAAGIEHVPVAVGVGEPPDAAPVLQRRQAAGHDAADAAETARAGEIVFRDVASIIFYMFSMPFINKIFNKIDFHINTKYSSAIFTGLIELTNGINNGKKHQVLLHLLQVNLQVFYLLFQVLLL